MKRLARATVAAVSVLSIGIPGMAAANMGTVIDTTGPDSNNTVTYKDNSDVSVKNSNDISASTSANQAAVSGDARVHRNTSGGSATSGDAGNANSVSAAATIDNGSSMMSV